MALTYPNATKAVRMTAVRDKIDAGSGAGKLKIYTTGLGSLLATFTMADPSGSVTNDVLTLDFDPDLSTTAIGDGTAAEATITDSDDVVVMSGLTVGTSGTHIVLDSVSITSGQTLTLATGTITHAT